MLTLAEVREAAHQAGVEAEESSGWLDGFEREVQDAIGTTLFVRDCRRPDGSESSVGESRIPHDSPEYYAAKWATFRELAQQCREAAEIVRRADMEHRQEKERMRRIEEEMKQRGMVKPLAGDWKLASPGIYTAMIFTMRGWRQVYVLADAKPDGVPATVYAGDYFENYGRAVTSRQKKRSSH